MAFYDQPPPDLNDGQWRDTTDFFKEAVLQAIFPFTDIMGIPRPLLRRTPTAAKEIYTNMRKIFSDTSSNDNSRKNCFFKIFLNLNKKSNKLKIIGIAQELHKTNDIRLKKLLEEMFKGVRDMEKPPLDVDETNVGAEKFQGFSNAHVCYMGTTRSGKTTLFLLHLAKAFYDIPGNIYWIDSGHTAQNFAIMQKLVYSVKALSTNDPNDKPKTFFNVSTEISTLMNSNLKSPDKKMVIFEDYTAYGKKEQDLVMKYLSVAKNTNAQVVLIKHLTNREKAMNIYFGYAVLCNPSYEDYNSIVEGVRKSTEVFAIKNVLKDLPQQYRALIYSFERKKIYFAYGRMGEITSTYELDKEQENERTHAKTTREREQSNIDKLSKLLTAAKN